MIYGNQDVKIWRFLPVFWGYQQLIGKRRTGCRIFGTVFAVAGFLPFCQQKKGNATKAFPIMNIAIYQYVQAVYQSLNSEVRAREMMIFSGVETVRVTCSLLSGHMEISLTAR